MFRGFLDEGMIRIALEKGLVRINLVDIRDFAEDKHRSVDDTPYGGGPGMVMKCPPIIKAVRSLNMEGGRVILTTPRGRIFDQDMAEELAKEDRIAIICGRYEGVDERVSKIVTDEVSIGDYILTGGELAGMVIVDAVTRLIEGVVGNKDSVREDSFSSGILDYPQYTRPPIYEGMSVPEILLSGHHERIRIWRRKMALRETFLKRPDLLEKAQLSEEDLRLLEELRREEWTSTSL
ncbi:MAG: tRNA (guanosine(37)-N1)-methyltransferase TrmD [bacterium]